MIIPDVLAPKVVAALKDMGADLSPGSVTLAQGIFNGKFVVFVQAGEFVEIICRHEATYQQIRQIVALLFGENKQ